MTELLNVLTVLVLLVNSFLIFINLGKRKSLLNRWIFLILFLGLFSVTTEYITSLFKLSILPQVLSFPIGVLYGPTMWLLIRGLKKYKGIQLSWLHFIPFCVFWIAYILISLNTSLKYQYSIDFAILIHFISLVHFGSYLLYLKPELCGLLKRFLQKKRGQEIIWYTSLFLIVSVMLWLVYAMIIDSPDVRIHRSFHLVLYVFFLLVVALVPYTCKKKHFYSDKFTVHQIVPKKINKLELAEKNGRSILRTISTELKIEYRTRVDLFIQTLAYLDSDLNKDKFCAHLDIPQHHVTPFLKEEFGQSFNKFLNQLRLDYAIKQLNSQDLTYTIDELSLICGYNSRASFYRNFHAAYGCSPHQYRQDCGVSLNG